MSERKFLIGSGYYEAKPNSRKARRMRQVWHYNNVMTLPRKVITLAVGNSISGLWWHTLNLWGNLGHIDDLVVSKTKAHAFCGWSGAMLALAMIAYCDESDFIYKEQDCLCFGPWVETMYQELGDAPVIFGSCKIQPAAQSLFLVKHAYIPDFVRLYLNEGHDNIPENLPEMKFARLEKDHGWKRFSFGYDRDRPFNVSDPVFYIQQVTEADLQILTKAKLI